MQNQTIIKTIIMRKKISFFLSIIILSACTNELNQVSDSIISNDNENEIIQHGLKLRSVNDEKILEFQNHEEFNEVLAELSDYKTQSLLTVNNNPYETINPLPEKNIHLDGFHSIYDDFVNAINEAESYYERPGGYEEFKEKYSMLFFPEEGDDYSAYLPISSKNVAKLVNSNGDVIIGGEKINLIDIHSYDDLVNLGLTPPIGDGNQQLNTTLSYPVNELPEVRCNNRKLWVVTRVTPGPNPAIAQEIRVEVCFRKKGFLGVWYNYSENSRLSWEPGVFYVKSGLSSHDYIWARVYQNGLPVPFFGLMSVGIEDCDFTKYYFEVNL